MVVNIYRFLVLDHSGDYYENVFALSIVSAREEMSKRTKFNFRLVDIIPHEMG